MSVGDVVWTRDLSSGRVHKRYRTITGELAVLEADNLDAAGDWETVDPGSLEGVDQGVFCVRCFPEFHPAGGDAED